MRALRLYMPNSQTHPHVCTHTLIHTSRTSSILLIAMFSMFAIISV